MPDRAPSDRDLPFASVLDQAALVRRGHVSPLELVDLYLERIERLDPQLNAYVTLDADGARAAARSQPDGPFAGVPIPIKDLNETAGLRTTYSCKAFADNVPDFDANVVRRIREAGFVVIGKTNTSELGTIAITESELNGDCRNPVGRAAAPRPRLPPGSRPLRTPATAAGRFAFRRRAAASSGSSRREDASRRRHGSRARSASAPPGRLPAACAM